MLRNAEAASGFPVIAADPDPVATDRVFRLDPATERFETFALPTHGATVRHLTIHVRTGDVWLAQGASPALHPARVARLKAPRRAAGPLTAGPSPNRRPAAAGWTRAPGARSPDQLFSATSTSPSIFLASPNSIRLFSL